MPPRDKIAKARRYARARYFDGYRDPRRVVKLQRTDFDRVLVMQTCRAFNVFPWELSLDVPEDVIEDVVDG